MWYILLAVHIVICLLSFLGIYFNVLKVHKYMFFVALLLPVWGALILIILHFQILFEADDSIDIDVEKMKLESELYKSVTVDEKKVAATTVPIEEALLINSPNERRSIIMDVLNDDPKEYIEFLQKAGNNEDTEVVHYAVTAMVEISKENDYMLQRYEHEYEQNPDDMRVLNGYADFLWNCLSQNLMQGQVEVINRELFSTLINKKIAMGGDINDYIKSIKNDLKRNQFALARETLAKMKELYSDNEEYYLLRLQYLASLGRGEEIQKLLTEIDERHIFLSAKAKEALAFWEI